MTMKDPARPDTLEFVVGSEKKLRDLLNEQEVLPLLKGAVRAGASGVMISDAADAVMWEHGTSVNSPLYAVQPFSLEGETIGKITVSGSDGNENYLKGLLCLLTDVVQTMLHNNLKRMLTTEMHTRVVNQSYEELLKSNSLLAVSEAKYRELAENLEKKVQERTDELKQAHARLLQQEKIASIGQLAAGVAHEINNPLGFIASNINTLQKYIGKYREMTEYYQSEISRIPQTARMQTAAEQKWKELKLDLISADIDDLIRQSLQGAERVKKIVSDLKGFSHIDEGQEAVIDINEEIDRTLNVLTHEIPRDAEIIRDYHPLPGFVCNPALICQAFLNIILNALQARREGLRFVISTDMRDNAIIVRFSDNGPGIPELIRSRIFDPFYTTKDVGKGTGMGLTVTYESITAYHGTIEVESEPGTGATFTVRLPLREN
ncbi:MAG: histidine kinase [Nitrospirae bacterium]|nr:histidine kinase [Nitrospirota bacterium]